MPSLGGALGIFINLPFTYGISGNFGAFFIRGLEGDAVAHVGDENLRLIFISHRGNQAHEGLGGRNDSCFGFADECL